MRRLCSYVAAFAAILMASAVLAISPAYADGLTYTFSPTSGPVGTVIHFSGSGCLPNPTPPSPGADLTFVVDNGKGRSKVYRSNADGTFSGDYIVQAPTTDREAEPGYDTYVSCTGSGHQVTAGRFTITSAPATTVAPTTTVAPASPGTTQVVAVATTVASVGAVCPECDSASLNNPNAVDLRSDRPVQETTTSTTAPTVARSTATTLASSIVPAATSTKGLALTGGNYARWTVFAIGLLLIGIGFYFGDRWEVSWWERS